MGDIVRLAVAGVVATALIGAYTAYRVWERGGRDEQRPADAIVVLGAAQYDGRPSPVFLARLDHALALYYAQVAPVLVVTGGKAAGDRTTEAAVARAYAVAHDVPPDRIIGEDRGRNTVESLDAVAALFRSRGIRSAVFVSDRTHMLRVLRIARDLGIDAYGSPTPTSPVDRDPDRRVDALVHEVGALAVYFVTGGAPPERPG